MNAQDDRPPTAPRDAELLADIDRVLLHPAPVTRRDPHSFEGFCAHLAAATPQAAPAFQEMLGRRLADAVEQRHEPAGPLARLRARLARRLPVRRGWRAAFASVAIAAGLLGTLSAVPAVRGWAENDATQLMQRLGLQNAPVSLDKPAGPGSTDNLSRDEAARMLGFVPLVPRYLPGGYAAPDQFTVYATSPRSVWWRIVKDNGPWYGADRISLLQDPASDPYGPGGKPLDIGSDTPTKVPVAGAQGLWFRLPDQIAVSHDGQRTVARYANVLRWERDGFRYTLTVPADMSLDEAQQIAASLQ